MILTRGRAAASLMLWLVVLGAVCASAQVDNRPHPPFRSSDACVEFARGDSPERRAQPAARRICDEIDRVWQDPTAAKPAADNPLRIDLGAAPFRADGDAAQGTVDGALLARILTIPELLPPRLDGGLVLENLIVTGTLELVDAAIDLPVVLRRARFRPAAAIMVADHLAPIAIRLDRARFADAFEIRESDIAGYLLIDDSTFAGGLTLAEVVVSSRAALGNPRAEGHLGRSAALHIRHSTFGADLSLRNLVIFSPPVRTDWGIEAGRSAAFEDVSASPRFEMRDLYAEGGFEIARSELGTVSLQDFRFADDFVFNRNRLTRMEIADGDFYGELYIDRNQALQGVAIDSIGIHPQDPGYVPIFRANQIGGSFRWAPSVVDANVGRIDLTYNRVDGLASIFPPDEWTAEIDLSNVQMPSRLEIGLTYWYLSRESKEALYRPEDGFDDFCEATDDKESERLINLTNASIGILAWNIPIGCGVRWDGTGLRYAYWGDPDLKGGGANRTDQQFIESLKDWRFTMRQENSEALDFMSTYLDSRGEFISSRDLQEEAKEVDYRPESLTDPRPWVVGSMSLPTGFGVEPKLVWLLVGPQTLAVLGGWVVYWLLWPTGFGVKPELALLWLFIGWLVGGAVYAAYRWRSRKAGWPPAVPSDSGLQEAPGRFVTSADEGRLAPITLETTERPSLVAGFMQYQRDRRPADFSIWAFSADAMLPVINLHAYTEYYPEHRGMRFFSFLQHIVGWWMLSIFLASATIL